MTSQPSTPLLTGPVFVNLPVADLARSRAFFTALGMRFDERMCNERGLCLVVREDAAYAMLLRRDFFASFLPGPVGDPRAATSVVLCVGVEEREDVDRVLDVVTAQGGAEIPSSGPDDVPPDDVMYGRSFADPDGHAWEALWVDTARFMPEPAGAVGSGAVASGAVASGAVGSGAGA